MPIQGFDYKGFAAEMLRQLQEILSQPGSAAVPDVVTDADKKFIIEIVKKFCLMSGEALYNDPNVKFNANQATLIVQFIAEWSFHKSIDMITGKVPPQFREVILQALAANIFNTAKLALIKNVPTETLVKLIEEKVNQVYAAELEKLVKKGVMSPQQGQAALSVSNLDSMAEKTEDVNKLDKVNKKVETQAPTPSDKKVLKLAALAIVLKNLPEEKANEILNVLDKNDVQHVINYMKMSNIEDKIDHQVIIKSLEEIKKIIPIPEAANTQKMLQNFRKLVKSTKPAKLSNIVLREREAVKDFVLDTSFPSNDVFSPYVIQSLITSVEEKLNDN